MGPVLERGAPVELVLVGAMTALHLAIGLRESGGNPVMGDPEMVKVPSEVCAELGVKHIKFGSGRVYQFTAIDEASGTSGWLPADPR